MIKLSAIILGLIGIWMIFLGYKSDLLPPSLTGVGFIIISAIFIFGKKNDLR